MKRDFDSVILDLEGAPLRDGPPKFKRLATGALVYDEASSEPVVLQEAPFATLKTVSFTALRTRQQGDDTMTADKKLAMFTLASKIAKGGVVEITVEESALLVERICKTYDFVTFGRANAILERDYEAPKEAEQPV